MPTRTVFTEKKAHTKLRLLFKKNLLNYLEVLLPFQELFISIYSQLSLFPNIAVMAEALSCLLTSNSDRSDSRIIIE